jgi:subtilisin family serine protease
MTGPINETVELRSARDSDGHGTHTASTAAGHFAYKASLLGYAEGIARGMAPRARIAAYKVCWTQGCFDSDILAAFDQAIMDNVDVISLSVGGGVVPYYLDSIAIGAFAAMKKGIFVASSAGNAGPGPLTVANVAPWITTVGATTLDRDFPADVVLDGGATIKGVSLYSGKGLGTVPYPLIFSGDAGFKGNGTDTYSSSLCLAGSLDPALVKGKIVLCERGNNPRVAKGAVVLAAGGVGMILANTATDGEGLIADSHVLPATAVGAAEGETIKAHITASKAPTAVINFQGTQFDTRAYPVVASFSARGPNPENPEILKPDLLGPGVNILAAWTNDVGPTGLPLDERRVRFNIISGTSMSCPHVSGLGALLKGAHPKWSPAAIKSALMTTASIFDNKGNVMFDEATGNMSSPFDFGAGHVQPAKALDPGLIYDLGAQDYVNFLCGLNYSVKAIQAISHDLSTCPAGPLIPKLQDLNYPTLSTVFDQSVSKVLTTTLKRTVTNVGPAKSTYTATVVAPRGVTINVKPSTLTFNTVDEKQSFTVDITTSPAGLLPGESLTVFGFLTWSDNTRIVQSPIAITRAEAY